MRKIMLLNAKGGCGKSTLTTNLASYYARQGKSVVIADFDPQGSSLEWLESRPQDPPVIRGIAAWRDPVRVPRSTDYVIMDVPAGCHGPVLTAHVKRAQTLVESFAGLAPAKTAAAPPAQPAPMAATEPGAVLQPILRPTSCP